MGGAWRLLPLLAVVVIAAGEPLPAASPEQPGARLALPIAFEPNRGQTDARVRYLARGADSTLFLTRSDAMLSLRSGAIRLRFVGGSLEPAITARGLLPGKVNYLRGDDPNRWLRGLPVFREVRYRRVYPGIDVLWHGRNGRLEYDFVVAPGGDPGRIAVALEGAERVRLDAWGDLLLGVGSDDLRQLRPFAYQRVNGRVRPVGASYTLDGNSFSLDVADYDRSRPLVIDPQLVHSTYLGGNGYDLGIGIARDPAGTIYATGYTRSTDFPTTPGAFQATDPDPSPETDVFVTKFVPGTSRVVYSTYLGGSFVDLPSSIVADARGNAYVAGASNSFDFPTTPSAFQPMLRGSDGFVAKLNSAGSDLVYSTFLGGSSTEAAREIVLAGGGRVVVTGQTSSSDFPTTPGAFQAHDPDGPGLDAFVVKLAPRGDRLVFGTYLGGSLSDLGESVATDDAGRVYAVGGTGSPDFPTTPGAFQDADPDPDDFDAYVVRLTRSGKVLDYSSYLGGDGSEQGTGIDVSRASEAYVTGTTEADDFPTTPSAYQHDAPERDGFVTGFSASGASLVYSTYLGGTFSESFWSIDIAADGTAYVTGATASTDFPTTAGSIQEFDPDPAHSDAFLTRLDAVGSELVYSTYLGGNEFDSATDVVEDGAADAFVVGQTASTDFPTTPMALHRNDPDPASVDAFITQLDTSPAAAG